MPDFREQFNSIERKLGIEGGDDKSEGDPEDKEGPAQDPYAEVERGGWRQGTVEHPDMPEGGRDFDRYQEVFGLDPEELRGKVVLDLGAGPEAKLSSGLRKLGITERTISMSPDYSVPKSQQRVKGANPEAKEVAGLGQALPLANESVDVVLSLHVTEHQKYSELLAMVEEVARVLKPGGTAHIGPTFLNEHEQEAMEQDPELKKALQEHGVEMSLRYIPKNIVHHSTGIDTASPRLALKPVPFDLTLRKSLSAESERTS